MIARSRIQTQSENSEIGIEIEIEFPDNLRMNPGDANMSFQLLIRPVSGEDTIGTLREEVPTKAFFEHDRVGILTDQEFSIHGSGVRVASVLSSSSAELY